MGYVRNQNKKLPDFAKLVFNKNTTVAQDETK